MSDALLQAEGVHFTHADGREVLKGVSLALCPGDRVGLLGANGCGKTTLLHLLVGLHRATAGAITCQGKTCTRESDFRGLRRRVGLLFQDSDDQLFCPTVEEDVAFGPLNLGKTREEARVIVRDTLDLVGLDGYEGRVTYRLSGGEKRLVALAAVLAMRPDVLLLDEPLTGLDEEHEARVAGILKGLPQAMLVVSHNQPFLRRLVHRTHRLKDGVLE